MALKIPVIVTTIMMKIMMKYNSIQDTDVRHIKPEYVIMQKFYVECNK